MVHNPPYWMAKKRGILHWDVENNARLEFFVFESATFFCHSLWWILYHVTIAPCIGTASRSRSPIWEMFRICFRIYVKYVTFHNKPDELNSSYLSPLISKYAYLKSLLNLRSLLVPFYSGFIDIKPYRMVNFLQLTFTCFDLIFFSEKKYKISNSDFCMETAKPSWRKATK